MTVEQTLLRIFVGCPSDVAAERQVIREVVEKFNSTWARHLNIRYEVVSWDTDTHPDFASDAQEVVNRQINDDYEVFVGALWTRLGTATPRAPSGTKEEFDRAYARMQEDPSTIRIMMYFSEVPVAPSRLDLEQFSRVRAFQDEVAEKGGLFQTYVSLENFRDLVEHHLATLAQEWGTAWGAGTSGTDASPIESQTASEIPAAPDASAPPAPPPAHEWTTEDDFVMRARLSDTRVANFRRAFVEDRKKAAVVESLFSLSGAFVRSNDRNDTYAAGFRIRIFKGPFVDRSNWAEYRTWEFAVAAERHLLDRLRTALEQAHPATEPVIAREWVDVLARSDQLCASLLSNGYAPTLLAVGGPLDIDMLANAHRHFVPDWELEPKLNRPWIIGAHNGLPILHFRQGEPAVYAVDLRRFGQLTKFSPDIEFKIEEFDEARAREMLSANRLAAALAEGEADTLENRLRRIRTQVGLTLWESYGLDVLDTGAVLAAKLEPIE
jgi:hypothetical protein